MVNLEVNEIIMEPASAPVAKGKKRGPYKPRAPKPDREVAAPAKAKEEVVVVPDHVRVYDPTALIKELIKNGLSGLINVADYVDVDAPVEPPKKSLSPPPESEKSLSQEKAISKDSLSPPPSAKEPAKVDQRKQTAREGRRTKLAKPGSDGAPLVSSVSTEDIKTGNPLAVRDQLMREYFALRNSTDEIVQKLCVLIFKIQSSSSSS